MNAKEHFLRCLVTAAACLVAGMATAQPSCSGDCDGDGKVIVAEILTGVNIALGTAVVDSCAGVDANADREVTVEELTAAVGDALVGCHVETSDGFDGFDRADLEYLAGDALDGRDNGSEGSLAAQRYLIDQIRGFTIGLNSAASGDDAFKQPFPEGTNIVAVMPGTESPDEYVIVGGHYDHFGGCNGVCNGATDNAAGTVAVLAIARELADNPRPLRRSVVFIFWDREEDGLLGSQYYIEHPLVPLSQTVAYVNFDIQGSNLLPSLRNFSFAVGAETGGARLLDLLAESIDGVGLDTRPVSSIFGQGRSDYLHFIRARVPTVFFSDSTGPCYHKTGDDLAIVDFDKLTKQSEIGARLVERLANTSVKPTYSRTAISYQDAVAVRDIVATALSDLERFSAEDQAFIADLKSKLDTVVAEGAASFDSVDILTLTSGVVKVIDILTDQPCSLLHGASAVRSREAAAALDGGPAHHEHPPFTGFD